MQFKLLKSAIKLESYLYITNYCTFQGGREGMKKIYKYELLNS
jgi:hypothetical protein